MSHCTIWREEIGRRTIWPEKIGRQVKKVKNRWFIVTIYLKYKSRKFCNTFLNRDYIILTDCSNKRNEYFTPITNYSSYSTFESEIKWFITRIRENKQNLQIKNLCYKLNNRSLHQFYILFPHLRSSDIFLKMAFLRTTWSRASDLCNPRFLKSFSTYSFQIFLPLLTLSTANS